MEKYSLKELINAIFNQNTSTSNKLNRIINNFKCYLVENDLNDTIFDKIAKQKLIFIGLFENNKDKYFIICIENLVIVCISSKISLFLKFLQENSNAEIISMSESLTYHLNNYTNQNKTDIKFHIVNFKDDLFLTERIDYFFN